MAGSRRECDRRRRPRTGPNGRQLTILGNLVDDRRRIGGSAVGAGVTAGMAPAARAFMNFDAGSKVLSRAAFPLARAARAGRRQPPGRRWHRYGGFISIGAYAPIRN